MKEARPGKKGKNEARMDIAQEQRLLEAVERVLRQYDDGFVFTGDGPGAFEELRSITIAIATGGRK